MTTAGCATSPTDVVCAGYLPSDLSTYWSSMGFGSSVPTVNAVLIGGLANSVCNCSKDEEVTLDIQVVGGLLQNVTIDVLFAPDVATVLAYACNSTAGAPRYSSVSTSWSSLGNNPQTKSAAMHATHP
jgi:hypothetical protein